MNSESDLVRVRVRVNMVKGVNRVSALAGRMRMERREERLVGLVGFELGMVKEGMVKEGGVKRVEVRLARLVGPMVSRSLSVGVI
jgi:hypothetical protein